MEQNTSAVTLIDFPQMISVAHPNAATYYKRDVTGLLKFFTMKLKRAAARRTRRRDDAAATRKKTIQSSAASPRLVNG